MADLHLIDGFLASPHRFLFHEESATAILSDLHLGIETTLARQGIAMPAMNLAGMRPALTEIKRRAKRLIIAGDLFDTAIPADTAIKEARQFLSQLHVPTTILLGNHDPPLNALSDLFQDSPQIKLARTTSVGGYTVAHGHRCPDIPVDTRHLITGHQHPAVTLSNRVQSAKMICYATCHFRPPSSVLSTLILLPAFSHAPLGTNLLTTHHWIIDLPRPKDDDVRIAGIVADCVLDFGPLSGL